MNTMKHAVFLALCGFAANASAGEDTAAPAKPQCEANYAQEGGFIAGRTFNTWGDVDVPANTAYKRVYAGMMKSGLKIASSDKELGMLTGEQHVTVQGKPTSLPLNVVVEEAGGGSKITVTKTTPSGYATSREFQVQSLCAVIGFAAG